MKKKTTYIGLIILFLFFILSIVHAQILTFIGQSLIVNDKPIKSDAVVVLNSGVELYARLIEAADLYNAGVVDQVVINGNRKSEALKSLEEQGYRPACNWFDNSVRVLEFLGVPRDNIYPISAENVYDTISEATYVGSELIKIDIRSVIITTSKSHTRRANYIWKQLYSDKIIITTIAADKDPYSPNSWWRDRRQIRWVFSEYGAWIFYFIGQY